MGGQVDDTAQNSGSRASRSAEAGLSTYAAVSGEHSSRKLSQPDSIWRINMQKVEGLSFGDDAETEVGKGEKGGLEKKALIERTMVDIVGGRVFMSNGALPVSRSSIVRVKITRYACRCFPGSCPGNTAARDVPCRLMQRWCLRHTGPSAPDRRTELMGAVGRRGRTEAALQIRPHSRIVTDVDTGRGFVIIAGQARLNGLLGGIPVLRILDEETVDGQSPVERFESAQIVGLKSRIKPGATRPGKGEKSSSSVIFEDGTSDTSYLVDRYCPPPSSARLISS